MTLARFNNMPVFFRDLDEFWRDFSAPYGLRNSASELIPPVDIIETDKSVTLHLDLPGVDPEKISVNVDGNVLTVTAERTEVLAPEEKGWVRRERRIGKFSRAFTLPTQLDGTTPEATFKHGVLKVLLPKKEAASARSLKVKVEA